MAPHSKHVLKERFVTNLFLSTINIVQGCNLNCVFSYKSEFNKLTNFYLLCLSYAVKAKLEPFFSGNRIEV